MVWNAGWKFKCATAMLGAVWAYIGAVGIENVTAITWSLGGVAIGFGMADLIP